jgi:hypothetical protein
MFRRKEFPVLRTQIATSNICVRNVEKNPSAYNVCGREKFLYIKLKADKKPQSAAVFAQDKAEIALYARSPWPKREKGTRKK